MKEQVLENIQKYNLIESGDNVVLGLSGGPDSVALLYVLLDIKEIDFNLHIAHVNHGVRGEEALRDENFVRNLAENLNIPYYGTRVNMEEYAKDKGISSEEAGRELRYGFFREITKNLGGGKIAVAHNKNDQAETLLMRVLRGTGIDGLKGMNFRSGDIIRPLLNIEREEIEQFLSRRNIEARIDRTNLEPIYNRNKIRLELIPYIEENFNPNIIETLWRTSRVAGIDSSFLEDYTKKAYKKIMKKRTQHSIILDRELFLREKLSIQQRIIRKAIMDINKNIQGLTEKHIRLILNLFKEGVTGKRIDIIDNLIAKTSYNRLIIERKAKDTIKDYLYRVLVNDTTYLENIGLELEAKILDLDGVNVKKTDKYTGYFDYNKINGELYIRNRRAGDRFVPHGMEGSKKIKDYFIDEKIPKDKRDKIPILTDRENIIWVLGYRTSNLYKLSKDTKKVLEVSFRYIEK